jgi:hypothetical protein
MMTIGCIDFHVIPYIGIKTADRGEQRNHRKCKDEHPGRHLLPNHCGIRHLPVQVLVGFAQFHFSASSGPDIALAASTMPPKPLFQRFGIIERIRSTAASQAI